MEKTEKERLEKLKWDALTKKIETLNANLKETRESSGLEVLHL
jgi:hypothetical protein